ncbi:MAG: hypothetical protein SGJ18_15095 [Pseudomonadota bacterium]|nr:hypothetical protein [Pseudomonadota bacterium]
MKPETKLPTDRYGARLFIELVGQALKEYEKYNLSEGRNVSRATPADLAAFKLSDLLNAAMSWGPVEPETKLHDPIITAHPDTVTEISHCLDFLKKELSRVTPSQVAPSEECTIPHEFLWGAIKLQRLTFFGSKNETIMDFSGGERH